MRTILTYLCITGTPKGGAWHYGSPLNTPLRLSIACSTTKHGYADGLSRLPLLAFPENHEDYAECFYFKQFQTLPVKAVQINRKTCKVKVKDKVLSCVFASVLSGNCGTVSKDLKLFFEKRNELSIF